MKRKSKLTNIKKTLQLLERGIKMGKVKFTREELHDRYKVPHEKFKDEKF